MFLQSSLSVFSTSPVFIANYSPLLCPFDLTNSIGPATTQEENSLRLNNCDKNFMGFYVLNTLGNLTSADLSSPISFVIIGRWIITADERPFVSLSLHSRNGYSNYARRAYFVIARSLKYRDVATIN